MVAEGDDAGGAMDIMRKVAPQFEGYDLRTTILGHTQRGGTPSYLDRALATRSGIKAVELLMEGKSSLMVGIKSDNIVTVPLIDAISNSSTPNVDKENLLKILLTGNLNDVT